MFDFHQTQTVNLTDKKNRLINHLAHSQLSSISHYKHTHKHRQIIKQASIHNANINIHIPITTHATPRMREPIKAATKQKKKTQRKAYNTITLKLINKSRGI